MFTESEKNNCFSVIIQAIVRANALSFILLFYLFHLQKNKKIKNRAGGGDGHFENYLCICNRMGRRAIKD